MHPGEAWLGEHLLEKGLSELGREVQGVNLDALSLGDVIHGDREESAVTGRFAEAG